MPGCPAQTAKPIRAVEGASGAKKARGPRNDTQISRHRNRHEGDVVTASSREVGLVENAGGKLASGKTAARIEGSTARKNLLEATVRATQGS